MKKILLLSFITLSLLKGFAQKHVGIGTTNPLAALHVADSSVLFTGPATLPVTATPPPVSGAGNRLFWYPDNAAFRAGGVGSTQWDKTNIGQYSFAAGLDSKASQFATTALGNNCIAAANYATAMGRNTISSGAVSTAMGFNTTASNTAATAMGNSTSATGSASTAMGSTNIAFGINTIAAGDNSNAVGDNSFSIGHYARAIGEKSFALGDSVRTDGYAATAMGYQTTASGGTSTAMGNGSIASGYTSTALGFQATASAGTSTAMGFQTAASGTVSTAMGFQTTASGSHSTAIGDVTTASGVSSIAMGFNTTASGNKSTAIGDQSLAIEDFTTAIGYFTTASGFNATAIGSYATASGLFSTAMGVRATASGGFSTAIGENTTSSGSSSTAMGVQASTNGHTNSFCIGGITDFTSNPLTQNTQDNQMMMRFDNYTFWVSPANYAYLIPASNGWAYTSDINKKEKFEELDGETVLNKISAIPFYSWNFKDPSCSQYRHYGIMAQDFYNAFGKDSYGNIGNDTTVSPLDLLGVAYSAIKELDKRSGSLAAANNNLQQENAAQQKKITDLQEQLAKNNALLADKLALLENKLNEVMAVKVTEAAEKNGVVINK